MSAQSDLITGMVCMKIVMSGGIPDYMYDDPRWDDDSIQNEEMKRKMSLQSWYPNHNYPVSTFIPSQEVITILIKK